MKKSLAIILALVMCLSSFSVFAAPTGEFTVIMDTKQAAPGETVELNINLENNSGILSMLFVLNFDSKCLKLVDVKDGGIVGGAVFGDDYQQVPYKALWNSASDKNFTKDGVLATLVFEVLETANIGKTDVTITYKQENIYDVDLNDVKISVVNGGVEITGGEDSVTDNENTPAEKEEDTTKEDAPEVNVPEEDTEEDTNEDFLQGETPVVSPSTGSSNAGSSAPSKEQEDEEPLPSVPEEDLKVELFSFDDVKENDWFFDNVQYVVKNKLMNGVSETEFAPNNTLTRAMLVTVLYRNAGEPATNRSIPFGDIEMGSWYANAVSWAKQNGIVSGVTENEFAPYANITREQIAAIMHRYAKVRGYDVSVGENTNILSYEDAESISEYAIDSIQYAVGSGLMKGKTETTLNPKDLATRAECAAILYRFIESNK